MISAREYLSTSFENPDREYVRGEIVERGMPDLPHGRMQAELGHHFCLLRDSDRLFPCASTRMRLGHDLYRIADVAVFAGEEPKEPVPSHPPLVAIEIISDDRFSLLMEKLAEYEKWGVPHIWVIEPDRRTFATYEGGALRRVTTLRLPGYPVEFSGELFS